jgi:hypothetical protein
MRARYARSPRTVCAACALRAFDDAPRFVRISVGRESTTFRRARAYIAATRKLKNRGKLG